MKRTITLTRGEVSTIVKKHLRATMMLPVLPGGDDDLAENLSALEDVAESWEDDPAYRFEWEEDVPE